MSSSRWRTETLAVAMAAIGVENFKQQWSVLKRHEGIPAVVIELYANFRWLDAGFCMRSFRHSLPAKYVYEYFEYTTENPSQKVAEFWKIGGVMVLGQGTGLSCCRQCRFRSWCRRVDARSSNRPGCMFGAF